jgi:hypothetical protein
MNGDVKELLREGGDRFTADMRVPADLMDRARTRVRRRKIAVRAALACGTAAVTAAAVITAGGVGARPGTSGIRNAQTTAYVVKRIENAVARLNMVVRTETTFSPAFPPITLWNYHGNNAAVQSGFMPPSQVKNLPWAQGQESWGAGTATINGKRTYVQVDYRHHEWYPAGGAFLVVPNGCSGNLYLTEFNLVNWASYIRHTLACGQFKIAGHAWINGKETIKLTGSQTIPNWYKGQSFRVDATAYVNQSTYLPVRLIWTNSTHAANGKLQHGIVRQDIRLLAPTPGNAAKVSITIPAGFRKVHGAPFGGPLFPFG